MPPMTSRFWLFLATWYINCLPRYQVERDTSQVTTWVHDGGQVKWSVIPKGHLPHSQPSSLLLGVITSPQSQDMNLPTLLPALPLCSVLCQILSSVGSIASVPAAATLLLGHSISHFGLLKSVPKSITKEIFVSFSPLGGCWTTDIVEIQMSTTWKTEAPSATTSALSYCHLMQVAGGILKVCPLAWA